jgi:hypothetical protein
MDVEYRIKEIKVPLKIGEIAVYYPQIKGEEEVKTGMLWWKKVTIKEVWRFFYKIGNEPYIDYDNSQEHYSERDKLLCFNTIKEAESFIEEYKSISEKRTKKFWSKQASNWDDERLVKYYKA